MIADISFLEKKNAKSRAGICNSGMVADISFLEHSSGRNRKIKSRRAEHKNPIFIFIALFVIITGVFGGYFSLSYATTTIRNKPLAFQGRITDANYVPLADTTTRNMVFRIHTTAATSACSWSTGNNDGGAINTVGEGAANCVLAVADAIAVPVTITRGIFTVPLGDTSYGGANTMPEMPLDFNAATLYLEIIVKNDSGTYETLSPRIRIGSSAYAYNADELDGINSTGFAILAGQSEGQTIIGGTATTDDLILRTTSGVGASGADMIFQIGNNGTTEAMRILNSGFIGIGIATPTSYLHVVQPAASSGSPTAFTIDSSSATHTTITAAESIDVNFNLARTVQFTGSTTAGAANIAMQRAALFQAPTYAFSSTGAQTITNAATLTVLNAPRAGTNATLSYNSALWLQGDSNMTRGRFMSISYPPGTTIVQSQALIGIDFNLNPAGGITFTAGNYVLYGLELNMPITSDTTRVTGATHRAIDITSGAWASSSGTNNWHGIYIDMPDINQSAGGTITSYGLQIRANAPNSGTNYAIVTDPTAGNVGIGDPTPTSFLSVRQLSASSGSPKLFYLNGGTHTGLTASTEAMDVDFDLARIVTFTADALVDFTLQRAVRINPPTYAFNAADVIAYAEAFRIENAPIAGNNATITNSIAFRVAGSSLMQSTTNAYGLYVDAPAGATNNYAAYFGGITGIGTAAPNTTLDLSGTLSYTPSTTQTITAVGNTVLANAAMIVLDPNGNYQLTSAPTILDGATGQIVYITAGNTEANTVTLQDEGSLANSNLQLGAATRAISGKDVLVLMFDGIDWIEISFADN